MTDVQDDQAASGLDEALGNTPPTPDTPAEQPEAKAPDGEATDKPAEEPDKPTDSETEVPEAPAEAEPAKEDDPAPVPEVDPKLQAQRSYADRQRVKAEAQAALTQQVRPKTADELVEAGLDQNAAELEALRQRVEVNEFTNTVADLTANINMDAAAIEQEFEIFNEKSPNFDKAFADKVSREYLRDADVKFDQTGQYVLSSRQSMYDYYKSRAEDRMAGMKQGQVSGQRAAERMLASADTPSSAAPPPPKEADPIEKGFAEVFGG